jgi:hypothetical protein
MTGALEDAASPSYLYYLFYFTLASLLDEYDGVKGVNVCTVLLGS